MYPTYRAASALCYPRAVPRGSWLNSTCTFYTTVPVQPLPSVPLRGAVDSVLDFCPLTQCVSSVKGTVSFMEKAHG